MPMNFLKFPAEIRLQIYEELLVFPDPISFRWLSWDPTPTPLFGHELYRYQKCPALLRASKSVHREASPVFYSCNRFEFSYYHIDARSAFASFLSQIGHQNATFLRHICFDFPAFDDAELEDDSLIVLELIRENCTGIAILEMSLRDLAWRRHGDANSRTINQRKLELLNVRFKAILSLKEVIVHDYEDPSDDLAKKMRDYGWTLKVANPGESKELEELEDDPDIDVEDYIATFEEEEEEEYYGCEDSDLDYD